MSGIGVSIIMLDRTAFQNATKAMNDGLDILSSKLKKLTQDALHKAAFVDYRMMIAALEDVRADLAGLQKIAERRRRAVAAFIAGKDLLPNDRRYATFDKSADSLSRGDAFRAGLILPLEPAQPPQVDPSANVADAMLQHQRYQQRD